MLSPDGEMRLTVESRGLVIVYAPESKSQTFGKWHLLLRREDRSERRVRPTLHHQAAPHDAQVRYGLF